MGEGLEVAKIQDVTKFSLLIEGGVADAHRFPAGDLADAIKSFSNIARRSAVLSRGGGNPSVGDNTDIPVFVEAIAPGSLGVDFVIGAAQDLVSSLSADGIKSAMKWAFDYAKSGSERRLREKIEAENRGKTEDWIDQQQGLVVDAAEGLSTAFQRIAGLVGEKATKVSVVSKSTKTTLLGTTKTETEIVIEIDSESRNQLKYEKSDSETQLFRGRVRRFSDSDYRGAIEVNGEVLRYWPAAKDAELAEKLSQNLAENNTRRKRGAERTLIDFEAQAVRSASGDIRRLIVTRVW